MMSIMKVAKRDFNGKDTKSFHFLILSLLYYVSTSTTHMYKACHAFQYQYHPHLYSNVYSPGHDDHHPYRYHSFSSYLNLHTQFPNLSTKSHNTTHRRKRRSCTILSLASRDSHDDDVRSNIEQSSASNDEEFTNITTPQQQIEFEKWGVTHQENPNTPNFPQTFDAVAQASFNAISSTIYNQQALDPNIIVNVMAESYMDKRPVGFMYGKDAGRDVGRLGIEIDGARYLLDGERKLFDLDGKSHMHKARVADLEGHALRRLSLMLAARLSSNPWEGFEVSESVDGSYHDSGELNDNVNTRRKVRPVALYFNTIRQALLANLELRLLKQQSSSVVYDNIRILCLGQDTIPDDMVSGRNKYNSKQHRRTSDLLKGKVLPQNGIILIIQPSDYNGENLTPSPAVGSISALQGLLAKASVAKLPSIVISPRLTEHIHAGFGISSGSDQSGYQQSSTYGGVEPPKGPTPWLLRDFIPPVYSWVGCVVPLIKRRPSLALSGLQVEPDSSTEKVLKDRNVGNVEVEQRYFSRISMTQSVLESGHPWHLFAVEEIHSRTLVRKEGSRSGSESSLLSGFFSHDENRKINHQYLASTSPSAGRPTSKVAREIFSKWS